MADRVIKVATSKSVADVVDGLQSAVEAKGATVFARVNHGGGGRSVGLDIGESELLIFGNPKLGTQAMIDDPLAGLFLPLKVLGYADAEQQVWLAYEDPILTLKGLSISADAEYVRTMSEILDNLTAAAAQ